jgi:carbamoyltransferase
MNGGNFPHRSIEFLLQEFKISKSDIDKVVFGWKINFWKWMFNRLSHFYYYKKAIEKDSEKLSRVIFKNANLYLRYIREFNKFKKEFKKIEFIDHHKSHAVHSFRTSGFKESLIIIADGAGELNSTTIFIGRNNSVREINAYPISQSLGIIYRIISRLMGMGDNGEGKLMALADYGKPLKEKSIIIYDRKKDKFKINLTFVRELSQCKRESRDPLLQIHKDIAATLQKDIENALLSCIKMHLEKTKIRNLCLGGGVFLNCKVNHILLNELQIKKVYIPAASNDSGTAIGAALAGTNNSNIKKLNSAFTGFKLKKKEVQKKLRSMRIKYKEVEESKLISELTKDILNDKLVAIARGRAEIGPRALGNRSIVITPFSKGIVDKINKDIKNRENWRPFAVMVLEEDTKILFGEKADLPYMNCVLYANQFAKKKISDVIHIDGSVRVQTVTKKNSSFYFKLLRSIKIKKGVGVLINTSFNNQEPIVNNTEDIIKTFFSTGLEILYIDNMKITK